MWASRSERGGRAAGWRSALDDARARWHLAALAGLPVWALAMRDASRFAVLSAFLVAGLAGTACAWSIVRRWQRSLAGPPAEGPAPRLGRPGRLTGGAAVALVLMPAVAPLAETGTSHPHRAALFVAGLMLAGLTGCELVRAILVDRLQRGRGVVLCRTAPSLLRRGALLACTPAVAAVLHRPARFDWRQPLPTVSGGGEQSHVEPFLGHVASTLAGHPVQVRCWDETTWNRTRAAFGRRITAFTMADDSLINVEGHLCGWLAWLAYDHARPADGSQLELAAYAVALLSHESQHARGFRAEAVAECYGVQSIRRTSALLGIDAGYADLLARTYWTREYPRNRPDYRSPDCRAGGELDLTPDDGVWP